MPDFDKLARDYHRREQLLGDGLAPWLQANLPSGSKAVDLTCGSGRHSKIIANHYSQVLATDLSPEMIYLAQKYNSAANIIYRAQDLFRVEGRYDLVFTAAAVHDLPDLSLALKHIKSLVAPGGTALLVDVTAQHSPKPWLYYRWSPLYWLFVNLTRMPPRTAGELYRLCTERNWVRHLSDNVYLSRSEFEHRYSECFPDAEFYAVGRLHVCHWTRPLTP